VHYLVALLVIVAAAAQAEQPLFSFGVIADAQYAEQDTAGARAYRESLAKLERCSAALQREKPEFVIHLGDFVDRDAASLDRILAVWSKVPSPRYHVLGNHDFVTTRTELLQRLGMPAPWYDFTAGSWRFIVLDGMNLSVAGGWPPSDRHATEGEVLLASLKQSGANNAHPWNGAVGPDQRRWLQRTLADAVRKGQRAIVFCHFPTLAESCRPDHLLWDHAAVASLLESSPATAAYMNGHDHQGGYAERNGVHYVTLPGMVEHDAASACKVVDVYRDKLVLRAAGQTASQPLMLRTAQ
jgi:manganese-dependent ADP-ribose/CDP-alcohol diphosphatase